jgi:hypothetical protein
MADWLLADVRFSSGHGLRLGIARPPPTWG